MSRSDFNEMYRFETPNFIVIARIYADNDVDTSFDDTGETVEKLNSGEWFAFGTIVEVLHAQSGAVLGQNSLWGSIYATADDFFNEHRGSHGKWGSYFPDMIRAAIREARVNIHRIPQMRSV